MSVSVTYTHIIEKVPSIEISVGKSYKVVGVTGEVVIFEITVNYKSQK